MFQVLFLDGVAYLFHVGEEKIPIYLLNYDLAYFS